MGDEKSAFNWGFVLGAIIGTVACVLVASVWSSEYNKLQSQAVEHHAAKWIAESNGSVTFTWIENAD